MPTLTPKSIANHLKEYVAGQEEAIQEVSTILFLHVLKMQRKYNHDLQYTKTNMLMSGPSGSGKTYMIELALDYINSFFPEGHKVPLVKIDASSLTQEGYVGDSVKESLANQLKSVQTDHTGHAIIYIDEFDKICNNNSDSRYQHTDKAVQYELLKMVEGQVAKHNDKFTAYEFDTTNMLFIFSGNFGKDISKMKEAPNPIGFTGEPDVTQKTLLQNLQEFGLATQLAGRIGSFAQTYEVTKEQLKEVLTTKKGNILHQYEELLGHKLSDALLDKLIEEAVASETGVRGLHYRVHERFKALIFDNPGIDFPDASPGAQYTADLTEMEKMISDSDKEAQMKELKEMAENDPYLSILEDGGEIDSVERAESLINAIEELLDQIEEHKQERKDEEEDNNDDN